MLKALPWFSTTWDKSRSNVATFKLMLLHFYLFSSQASLPIFCPNRVSRWHINMKFSSSSLPWRVATCLSMDPAWLAFWFSKASQNLDWILQCVNMTANSKTLKMHLPPRIYPSRPPVCDLYSVSRPHGTNAHPLGLDTLRSLPSAPFPSQSFDWLFYHYTHTYCFLQENLPWPFRLDLLPLLQFYSIFSFAPLGVSGFSARIEKQKSALLTYWDICHVHQDAGYSGEGDWLEWC